MTAHRAAAQAEADVTSTPRDLTGASYRPGCGADLTSVPHDYGRVGTVLRQARRRGPVAPASQPEASHALVPAPESVKVARDFTRATLAGWGMIALADDAELVISELVTNALRHTTPGPGGDGPVIRLKLLGQAPYLMCLVSDPSRDIPLRRRSSPDDPTGRGLQVIEACSSRWGWHLLDDGGKVVWAVLPQANAPRGLLPG